MTESSAEDWDWEIRDVPVPEPTPVEIPTPKSRFNFGDIELPADDLAKLGADFAKLTDLLSASSFNVYDRRPNDEIVAEDAATLRQESLEIRDYIDAHQKQMDMLRDFMQLAERMRAQHQHYAMQLTRTRNQIDADTIKATKLQTEKDFAKQLEPDLDNPELQALIKVLESWENYPRMDDYQIEDVIFYLDRWLRTKDQPDSLMNIFTRGIINANDTGMGKTLETVAFLWVMRQVNPECSIIWFTKISLVKETAPEATQKWGFPILPIFGNSPDKVNSLRVMLNIPGMAPAFAINYEAVNNPQVLEVLNEISWDFMVIDEVHKLRGGANYRPTKMWTNTKKFKERHRPWPIMLSGSIINNNAKELWSYLHIMDPLRFPDMWEFDTTMRATNAEASILKVLAPSMRRRRKDEVSIKMPERVVQHHILELEPNGRLAQIYEEFSEDMLTYLENAEKERVPLSAKTVLDQLIRLRGLLVAPGYMKIKRKVINPTTLEVELKDERLDTGTPEKLNEVIELIDDLTMEGQQVVVASSGFKAPLDYIAEHINPLVKVEKLYGGNTSIGGDIAARFRAAETQVILTNLQSGAEGFNLHKTVDWPGGAEHLIMIDDWYNPELVRQMWDRVWRRGAINRVIIHVFQMDNTVDQYVEAIRQGKASKNAKITESTSLRAGEWKDLLGQYLRPKSK